MAEDWIDELKRIKKRAEEKKALEEEEKRLQEEKEKEIKSKFVSTIRPYLKKLKEELYPDARIIEDYYVGGAYPTTYDIAFSVGNACLCFKKVIQEDKLCFTAIYIHEDDEGRRWESSITVDKPEVEGNVIFTLKEEHIIEALKKFVQEYEERLKYQ